ncbi:hypothetical protein P7K49_024510 [Saguinus oedipus]|uniref:Homeobox domain-containing protein n=1 Tax=Saguinus oedipus TaxID=9490 RepID=A0ABQ9UPQ2_SAGOE|nr:hypothetical protein P7K49_024510 [Saguinus oedipus]
MPRPLGSSCISDCHRGVCNSVTPRFSGAGSPGAGFSRGSRGCGSAAPSPSPSARQGRGKARGARAAGEPAELLPRRSGPDSWADVPFVRPREDNWPPQKALSAVLRLSGSGEVCGCGRSGPANGTSAVPPQGTTLAPRPKRIRTAFSPSQLLRLEHAFEKNHYVVGAERKQLAHSLSLTETQEHM